MSKRRGLWKIYQIQRPLKCKTHSHKPNSLGAWQSFSFSLHDKPSTECSVSVFFDAFDGRVKHDRHSNGMNHWIYGWYFTQKIEVEHRIAQKYLFYKLQTVHAGLRIAHTCGCRVGGSSKLVGNNARLEKNVVCSFFTTTRVEGGTTYLVYHPCRGERDSHDKM